MALLASSSKSVPQTEEIELRFVDLCAGLGGFHEAAHLAQRALASQADTSPHNYKFKFTCVFACDIDDHLRELYPKNFKSIHDTYKAIFPFKKRSNKELYDDGGNLRLIHGDLSNYVKSERQKRCLIPKHDILFAGFPCQPFSKSGAQKGFDDLRGTVFGHIASIIKARRPNIVILENVGNFERHDNGNTWKRVKSFLESTNYTVRATTHVVSGHSGNGLLSPHHIGFPHHRERFFVVAIRNRTTLTKRISINPDPFPGQHRHSAARKHARTASEERATTELHRILSHGENRASNEDLLSCALPTNRVMCIDHWNELLALIDSHYKKFKDENSSILGPMPSFPIWGYELDPWKWYPAETPPTTLLKGTIALRKAWRKRLQDALATNLPPPKNQDFWSSEEPEALALEEWVKGWPAYATREEWPDWKVHFIRQNRKFALNLCKIINPNTYRDWLDRLSIFAPSLQKLEWNCQGETLNLYHHILQFRPSGLRSKRFKHVPALVAMTATQVPVVPIQTQHASEILNGAKSRFLLQTEALMLQGFPPDWVLPKSKSASFHALGNAIHVHLVRDILIKLFGFYTPAKAIN